MVCLAKNANACADHGADLRHVARLLMLSLQDAARRNGFTTMEGMVLSTNRKMLKFARQLGFALRREPGEGDTVHVALQL